MPVDDHLYQPSLGAMTVSSQNTVKSPRLFTTASSLTMLLLQRRKDKVLDFKKSSFKINHDPDKVLLKQVMTILSDAIKYTEEDGEIYFVASADDRA